MVEYEVTWKGRESLTDSLERDYAVMSSDDGYDLIWEPTSPLTTPWWEYAHMHFPDSEQHVTTSLESPLPHRRVKRLQIMKDWSREYTGAIAQQGSYK